MSRNHIITLVLTLLSLSTQPFLAYAALVNVTVDDAQLDASGNTLIQYTPSGGWNIGNNCSACTARPNSPQTFDGTWHDSTHEEGAGADGLTFATLQFTGDKFLA